MEGVSRWLRTWKEVLWLTPEKIKQLRPVPWRDHVVRIVRSKHVQGEDINPEAFAPRPGELALSVHWLEYCCPQADGFERGLAHVRTFLQVSPHDNLTVGSHRKIGGVAGPQVHRSLLLAPARPYGVFA